MSDTFVEFPKIARLNREITITEKIDGTNAQVLIANEAHTDVYPGTFVVARDLDQGLVLLAGSRNRYLLPGKDTDNFGFAGWAKDHASELFTLGVGRHYGEWWGKGIQRGYGLEEKRFSLFNSVRWIADRNEPLLEKQSYAPACCHVVPQLWRGEFKVWAQNFDFWLKQFAANGSAAAPGYPDPEGVVVFHTHSGQLFKYTFDKNDQAKSAA